MIMDNKELGNDLATIRDGSRDGRREGGTGGYIFPPPPKKK